MEWIPSGIAHPLKLHCPAQEPQAISNHLNLKPLKVKSIFPFLRFKSQISDAQQPHVAGSSHIGQSRYRMFLSLQTILLYFCALEG